MYITQEMKQCKAKLDFLKLKLLHISNCSHLIGQYHLHKKVNNKLLTFVNDLAQKNVVQYILRFLNSRVNKYSIFTGISKEILNLARHGDYWSSNGPTHYYKDVDSEYLIGDSTKLFQVLWNSGSSHLGIIDSILCYAIL